LEHWGKELLFDVNVVSFVGVVLDVVDGFVVLGLVVVDGVTFETVVLTVVTLVFTVVVGLVLTPSKYVVI
jgi:hypothetical protein